MLGGMQACSPPDRVISTKLVESDSVCRREKPRGSRSPLGVFSMRVPLRLLAHLPAETGGSVFPVDSDPQAGPGCVFRRRCGPLPRCIQVQLSRSLSTAVSTPRGRLSPVRSPASSDDWEAIRCRAQLPMKWLVRFRGRAATFAYPREALWHKRFDFAKRRRDRYRTLPTAAIGCCARSPM